MECDKIMMCEAYKNKISQGPVENIFRGYWATKLKHSHQKLNYSTKRIATLAEVELNDNKELRMLNFDS